jgi:hypothetical protein
MLITWYYYFSWWIFIWFILFKLNIIKYSPYMVYLLAISYIICKITIESIYFIFIDKEKIKNYSVILAWLILVTIIDIIPFFYLKKQTNIESIIFSLILVLIYLLYMKSIKVNVIDLYFSLFYRKLSDKYTLKTIFENIFNI